MNVMPISIFLLMVGITIENFNMCNHCLCTVQGVNYVWNYFLIYKPLQTDKYRLRHSLLLVRTLGKNSIEIFLKRWEGGAV